MERVVRLYQLWSWLPHFRAVAETEHLPTASEALGISASSLSRALKQLEGALGRELFEREGRNIRLNPDGRVLLGAVRAAMRGIDDAVSDLVSESSPLSLRIAAPGPLHAAVLLDLCEAVSARHDRVAFELSSCPSDEIVSGLCRGDIDVCLHEDRIDHPDLESIGLGTIGKFVACAPTHPLASGEPVDAADVADHRFAAPPPDPRGIRGDGWPVDVPRTIGLTVSHMQMGIDACQTGRFLTVLPEPVIEASGLIAVRVRGVNIPSVPLHATTRARLETRPAELGELLEALESAFSTR